MKSVSLKEMVFVTPSPNNKVTSADKTTTMTQREGDYSISKVETNHSSNVVEKESTVKKRSIKMISVTNLENLKETKAKKFYFDKSA